MVAIWIAVFTYRNRIFGLNGTVEWRIFKSDSPRTLFTNIAVRTSLTPCNSVVRNPDKACPHGHHPDSLVRMVTTRFPSSARPPPGFSPRPYGHHPFFLVRTATTWFPSSSTRPSSGFPHPHAPAEPSGFPVTSGHNTWQCETTSDRWLCGHNTWRREVRPGYGRADKVTSGRWPWKHKVTSSRWPWKHNMWQREARPSYGRITELLYLQIGREVGHFYECAYRQKLIRIRPSFNVQRPCISVSSCSGGLLARTRTCLDNGLKEAATREYKFDRRRG